MRAVLAGFWACRAGLLLQVNAGFVARVWVVVSTRSRPSGLERLNQLTGLERLNQLTGLGRLNQLTGLGRFNQLA
ncbi:hypothetical protein, partial [Gordonia sp. (in: high G+C Gram-positive bacteria)]|uniref:hypothetical protein n=1 Tax=Gordonia sp. (in: high G+C Gram-positive bacteria) TaxID=84139 RepID=UPI0026200E2F